MVAAVRSVDVRIVRLPAFSPVPERLPSGVYRTPKPHGVNPVEGSMTITQAQLASLIQSSGALSAFASAGDIAYDHPGVAAAGVGLIEGLTGEAATVATNTPGILAGTTASFLFKLDRARGVLNIHHRSRGYTDGDLADVGAAAIQPIALEQLARAGIRPQAGATIKVQALERKRVGSPTDVRRLAYKVFVDLRLSGLSVEGPRAVLSYFVDGSLHKIMVTWPEIHSDPDLLGGPLTPASAAAAAFALLSGHPLGSISTPLTVAPGMVVDGVRLRRALFLSGRLHNPDGDDRRGELIVPL